MKINRVVKGTIDRISLVKEPANNSFICSETSCSIDGNSITVLVLSADNKVYREEKEGVEARFIYFNSEKVSELAHEFIRGGSAGKLSISHQENSTDKIQLQESYVVDGDWFIKLELDSELMDSVKKDDYRGVSIEMLATEETVIDITKDTDKLIADAKALDIKSRAEVFGEL